ncbi:PEP-CTERM sorting domain-containing protein [Sphingobium bisphenolivorans]|uniref:PEP-CTERM sorting domain-containing protein n=1 Tax=Sphingobium bisphenolivorans TaxID=1335760 RepID=UPI0003A55BF8|nr:PEP-CTERM sorting domain-containing protein [Sphingobium bisphenolivorans]
MNVNKLFLVLGLVVAIGAAAPADAGRNCWWGKCGGGSSSGGTGSSGGTPTPVPEPEQMALFGMGAAALGARFLIARRKQK